MLAETLRLGELQVQGIEVPVGNFFIDILARDIEGRVVVIENQFGQTDHTHLGQILTYIAGQDGHATVVWIAETIREEHRAAIDWLNGSTFEGFDFFAVKVEALRIGESPPAPWFNVVAKPNNWTRGVGRVTRATSDLPTEQQILGRLENSVGNSVGGSIRELAEWASAQGFILRPTGKNLYFGCRNKDGERVEPFSLDTDGVLWAQFGECKKRPPFDAPATLQQLRDRLGNIPNLRLSNAESYPTASIKVLSSASFDGLRDLLLWVQQQTTMTADPTVNQ
jgi:hypothetical protein